MKKYMVSLAVIALLFTGCAHESSAPDSSNAQPTIARGVQPIAVPDITDVKSMREWASALPGAVNVTVTPKTSEKQIQQVLTWLRTSKEVEYEKPTPGKGGYPPGILITLNNGQTIGLEPAVDWTVNKLPDGRMMISDRNANGYVEYSTNSMQRPIRLYAPQLYDWITATWREDPGMEMALKFSSHT